MASNVPKGTFDPLTTTRPPVAGDTQVQYDITRDEYQTAVYDGIKWNVVKTNQTQYNVTASQVNNANYNTVSAVANAWKSDLFVMFEQHVRVAEYVNEKGKIERVQLEWREGQGSRWQPITRVQIKI